VTEEAALSGMHPTERFSSRVADYVQFRPSYPEALINFLIDELGLGGPGRVADIGAGTGILTSLLLDRRVRVVAIEPNDEMREAADDCLGGVKGYSSVKGRSESTSLASHSVAAITVAQAFHWFEPAPTREEFIRILEPAGLVLLIWNKRSIDEEGFNGAYEKLVAQFGTDYRRTRMYNFTADEVLTRFYCSAPQKKRFDNSQSFDFDGLMGRLRSCSYIPNADSADFPALKRSAQELFDQFAEDGQVTLKYDANVFWGAVSMSAE
jgi:SAM-dependent methyltransferase